MIFLKMIDLDESAKSALDTVIAMMKYLVDTYTDLPIN